MVVQLPTPIFQIFLHNLAILTCTSESFRHVPSATAAVFSSILAVIIRAGAPMCTAAIDSTPSKFFLFLLGYDSLATHMRISHLRRWVLIEARWCAMAWSVGFAIFTLREFAIAWCHSFRKIAHTTLRPILHPAWSTCHSRWRSASKWAWSWGRAKLGCSGPTWYTLARTLPWNIGSACHSGSHADCWPIFAVCWRRSHVFFIKFLNFNLKIN